VTLKRIHVPNAAAGIILAGTKKFCKYEGWSFALHMHAQHFTGKRACPAKFTFLGKLSFGIQPK